MKRAIFSFLSASLCLFSACYGDDSTFQDKATGIVFPKQVSFEHQGKKYTLDATGSAVRKILFIKVYAIASYLQANAHQPNGDVINEIMQDTNAKQLTLKWTHEATLDQFNKGYNDGFQKSLSEQQLSQLQNDINQFLKFYKEDIKVGDEHVLRWIPEGYVEVLVNGNKVGNISSKEFAAALWGLWFGELKVVDKNSLVSFMK